MLSYQSKDMQKRMWQTPWAYKESIAITIGFIMIGAILQLLLGNFNFLFLEYPINLIFLLCLIGSLAILVFFRKTMFYQWLSGVPFSVTLIASIGIFAIIMGLVPQLKNTASIDQDIFTRLGFRQMTTCWIFILLYLCILLSLGSLIIRRLIDFRWQDYAFYLNHIGLWILLLAAGIGAADIRRYVMYVTEGEVEWRVYNDNNEMLQLPIAIQLNDFEMEIYPPKLAVIDRNTGEVLPSNNPDYYQIDTNFTTGRLLDWDIVLEDYIHQAVRNSDSTYHEVPMPGATPAAKIKATNINTKQVKEGWVCGGNMAQLYMTLSLDSTLCVVMTQPEPKKFTSDINVFIENGVDTHAKIEVNKPLEIGDWTIYQYGYDNKAGTMSTYSSMELVYDPWVKFVYFGIFLLALGSICLLWSGNKKRKRNDLE